MSKKAFWLSLAVSIVGWAMFFIDRGMNGPWQIGGNVGLFFGVAGIAGIVLSIINKW